MISMFDNLMGAIIGKFFCIKISGLFGYMYILSTMSPVKFFFLVIVILKTSSTLRSPRKLLSSPPLSDLALKSVLCTYGSLG